ncbi:MAG: metallophosphoesterase family protein, partial [Candidatus Latescibacteria bacterium]|nr:metallophosphoesterase family protein [Candidatus Latescibacterota bacterium]
MTQIAVISDSHNQIRPEMEAVLRTADAVIHAGDIASDETYDGFRRINSRTTFVRGNMDRDARVRRLPGTQALSVDGFDFYAVHDLTELDLDPAGRF